MKLKKIKKTIAILAVAISALGLLKQTFEKNYIEIKIEIIKQTKSDANTADYGEFNF